jgi:maltose alpha-D-glucosyltransferase/alpha-amylase
MAKQKKVLDDKLHWYKDAVIYELHIKAFFDGNNDGIGDFKGLLQKLDYLQDLGVTAIWLLPFYPSPLKDDGYDIADYYSINPSYGTIQQFRQFLEEAHKRNLKVITELVINHTSDQHPWFQRARKAPIGSEERNYYVWTDNPNQYKDVRIIFQDFEASNWTWDPVAQQYYWHRFFHHQPDLNYDNPKVQQEVFRIIDYWCAMGVDGFRLDAVPYLFEREGTNGENLPETHAFLKKLRKHVDEKFPGTVFLAEANMWPEDSASYFGSGDECHMNYHFPVMPRMFMALQREDRYPITDIFDQTPEIPETCQWAMFLRNHDELTLEMVTDEERDYMYKVYAKDPKARINLGIRHRLAPLMGNDRKKIELMNSLLFSLPGTPVLYYGDEIGMGDNFYLGDRDGVRTPMQWSPDRNAGFSDTNPQQLYLPVILDPQYHYESVNVETQRGNTSSLFWYMKRLINMRKKYKAFSRGTMNFIQVDNPKILAFTRSYDDQTLLIIVNLSKYSQPAEINLEEFKGYVPMEAFSKNRFPVIKEDTPYFFTLGPHSFQWFELQKLSSEATENALPSMKLDQWEDLLSPYSSDILLNTILPAYFSKSKWFIGQGRAIYSISITKQVTVPLTEYSAHILLLEVLFESGLPENYFLPITFARDKRARQLTESSPQSIIANLTVGQEEGVLCDALFTSEVQSAILNQFGSGNNVSDQERQIRFIGNSALRNYIEEHAEIRPRIHQDEPTYTSITYDNRYILKVYRKVDKGINPDVEITHYLTKEIHFPYSPKFSGLVEWQMDNEPVVLAMMELMVENHGTGQSFMLERINNYIERILARDINVLSGYKKQGSLIDPVRFEQLSEELKEFLSPSAAEEARLIGIRTGELHLALSSGQEKDFKPEEFSLHYQRSLFSSMQSLVRETYQSLHRRLKDLPEEIRSEAEAVNNIKSDLLNSMKRIYAKKLNVLKTRIHGNYQLNKILLTGKDIAIHDFGGNPMRPFSERRLKRSPLRDITAMIRSFYYTAFEGFLTTTQVQNDEISRLLPFAELWAYYMSGFFTRGYLDTVKNSGLIPDDPSELKMMMHIYLTENSLYHLNYELNHRPEWSMVPLKVISSLMKENLSGKKQETVK